MTAASIQILSSLDDLLSDTGAAFLDSASKHPGNNRVLLYQGNALPSNTITKSDITRSLSFAQANVGGLKWDVMRTLEGLGLDSELAAWKKGDFYPQLLPKLSHVAKISEDMFTNSQYRAIYRVKNS